MIGLWIIEQKGPVGETIAPLLQGEFLLRLIASEKNLLNLIRICRVEDLPALILINGCQNFSRKLNWRRLRSQLPYKTLLAVYGFDPQHDAISELQCSRERLPFTVKFLVQNSLLSPVDSRLSVDFESRTLSVPGCAEKISLSHIEAKILKVLLGSREETITRDHLIQQAWEGAVVSRRTIDSHISRLRKKLKSIPLEIEGIYGGGYRIMDI